jgi:diamine N-acetyltransferase
MCWWLSAGRRSLRLSTAPVRTFFVIEDAAGPLGYARLWEDPETPEFCLGRAVELVRFYMARRAIGTGLAGELMEYVLRHARRNGFEEVYLGVWEKNGRAQRFYEKWGFAKVGEKVFLVGTDAQTDWYYLRSLAG